jgi:DNA-binding MarR family transcriptional regulator
VNVTADHFEVLDAAMAQFLGMRGVLDPSQAVPGFGVSMSEAMTLRHLAEGPLTQHELGNRLGLEKSTVSRLIDAMVRKQWVEKTRDPHNRRYQRVRLTRAGGRAASRVGEAVRRRHAGWFEALTAEERDALAIGLGALVRVMAEQADADGHSDQAGPEHT